MVLTYSIIFQYLKDLAIHIINSCLNYLENDSMFISNKILHCSFNRFIVTKLEMIQCNPLYSTFTVPVLG